MAHSQLTRQRHWSAMASVIEDGTDMFHFECAGGDGETNYNPSIERKAAALSKFTTTYSTGTVCSSRHGASSYSKSYSLSRAVLGSGCICGCGKGNVLCLVSVSSLGSPWGFDVAAWCLIL